MPVHLSSLIPRTSTFTLAISCLTTSNLPWFMDLTFPVPMQYCSLQHWTLASIISPLHNWLLFLLWPHPFILSGVISPLTSNSILGTYRPGEFTFQCCIFLPVHTVNEILQDVRVEEHPLISCKNSKIATCCWTSINRRMLDPTNKRYLTSKGKGVAPARQLEGWIRV